MRRRTWDRAGLPRCNRRLLGRSRSLRNTRCRERAPPPLRLADVPPPNRPRRLLVGDAPPRLGARFQLLVGGALPQLSVALRPAGVLPVGDAPPRLGARFQLLVGGALPQLSVGLRPAGVLPVGDAPPRFADVSRLPPRLNGACFRLLVGGAHPLLAAGLRPDGVLPA